jgi:hypothetical protein
MGKCPGAFSIVGGEMLCPGGSCHQCWLCFELSAGQTAVRTLNRVAMTHPMAVTNSNIEMEALIPDVNRSIATLAISTLLKTGAHSCNGCVLWAWGGRKFGRGQVPTFQVVLADRGHWRKAVSCTCMRTVLRAERFEKTTSRDKGNAGVQPSFGFASCDRLQPHHGSLHTTGSGIHSSWVFCAHTYL